MAQVVPALMAQHDNAEDIVNQAEEALQRGLVDDALVKATAAVKQAESLADKARAIQVLIQTEFHFHNSLTDLNKLLQASGLALKQLPVAVVLLWGVVAVELQAAEVARGVLAEYLAANNFAGISREDALAISRLYAVQLLAGLCQDFGAAADWLESGGAGLSVEQQELLLLEVDEAEELVQEEHLAAWTVQHAAEAAQPGACFQQDDLRGLSTRTDRTTDDGTAETASLVGSIASTTTAAAAAAAAIHDLGPSVSGVLSTASLHPAGSVAHEQELDANLSKSNLSLSSSSIGGGSAQQQQQQKMPSLLGASAETRQAAAAAAAAVVTEHAAAAEAEAAASERECSSSPSLGAWRPVDDSAEAHDQAGRDDNAFVTMTGFVTEEIFDAVTMAAGPAAAVSAGDDVGDSAAANKHSSKAVSPSKSDSSRSDNSKGHTSSGELVQRAAAAASAAQQQLEQELGQHQDSVARQEQQQQQQQQWLGACTNWASNAVQDTLRVLNLQDVPPWELAGGAGLAVLIGVSLYRERRNLKRMAASAAAAITQTAQMALGLSGPVNAMAAVPGTGHMMR